MPLVLICTLKMVTTTTMLNLNQKENITTLLDLAQDVKAFIKKKEEDKDQPELEFL